jgi:hypothetical protein
MNGHVIVELKPDILETCCVFVKRIYVDGGRASLENTNFLLNCDMTDCPGRLLCVSYTSFCNSVVIVPSDVIDSAIT